MHTHLEGKKCKKAPNNINIYWFLFRYISLPVYNNSSYFNKDIITVYCYIVLTKDCAQILKFIFARIRKYVDKVAADLQSYLKGQCHKIFDLWFFRILFRICWEINETVLIPRFVA
jgi:hypothetical protein